METGEVLFNLQGWGLYETRVETVMCKESQGIKDEYCNSGGDVIHCEFVFLLQSYMY